jgi:hypothetical protein
VDIVLLDFQDIVDIVLRVHLVTVVTVHKVGILVRVGILDILVRLDIQGIVP